MTIIVTLDGVSVAASTLIDRAMRLISQISPSVSPTTEEYATCLTALNAMSDSWRTEGLISVTVQDESLTLVSTQASYTIGLGGDLNTNRPTKIYGAYLVDSGGVSYDVNIIESDEYASIGLKSSSSTLPNYLYYSADVPLGNLWVYPVPSAAHTLHVLTPTPAGSYATTATTAYLAPGWEDALVYNLAVRIAPEFEKMPSPLVIDTAKQTKANIKRANMRPIKLHSELAAMVGPKHSNILTNA